MTQKPEDLLKTNKNILECFRSVQGEGIYIGVPSIFIRFAKCNLNCDFCDTKYSWNEEGKYSINDALEFIIKNENKYRHVVLTGGEPLLYQDDLKLLLQCFPSINYTIETNGTIKPNVTLTKLMYNESPWCGLWSVSPKLHLWDKTPLLKQIVGWNAFDNVQFKFVITCPEDLEKIRFLVNTQTIDKQIIIQPDGNRKDYDIACRELADWVNENEMTQVRVLPQFHRLCWGQKRGK